MCETAGYWQEQQYGVVCADPEHPKHGDMSGEDAGNARTFLPWMSGTTVVLRITLSLCIQNAISNMLCVLVHNKHLSIP